MDKQSARRSLLDAFRDDDDLPSLPREAEESAAAPPPSIRRPAGPMRMPREPMVSESGMPGFVPARAVDAEPADAERTTDLDGLLDRLQSGLRLPSARQPSKSAPSPAPGEVDQSVSVEGYIAHRHWRSWTYCRVGSTVPAFEARRAEIRMAVLDDDAILAAMRVAQSKWGTFRPSGPPQFVARCEELARRNGITMTGASSAPEPSNHPPTTHQRSEAAKAARGDTTQHLAATPPADSDRGAARAVSDGNRERMYFRDLLVDAGFNLRALGLAWSGVRDAEVSGLDARARSTLVSLASRACIETVRVDGMPIRVVEAVAASEVLRDAVAGEVRAAEQRGEGLAGAARLAGYALGRYGHALGVMEWDQALDLMPPNESWLSITSEVDPSAAAAMRSGWTMAMKDMGVDEEGPSASSSAQPGLR